MDWFAIISLLIAIWTLEVNSVYHMLSMAVLKPSDITRNNISFGYSIAYQQKSNRLVVGAPKGSSVGKLYECNLMSTACAINTGLFECRLDSTECTEVITTIKDNEITDSWFGATVATGQDFSVACAPRYTERREKLGTFGRCYVKNENSIILNKLQRLNDSDKEPNLRPYEKYMDSFGWSLDVDSMDSIIVGGPAMFTGRAILYTDKKANPSLIPGSEWNVDYTFGYSVTSGFFTSLNETFYAISAPYGLKGYGKVILTDGYKGWTLEQPREFKPAVGSLLGASMCSAKLRGVGQREALLIGAPTFAQKGKMNVGIVYVYLYNLETKAVTHQKTILGTVNGGQFGSAVMSLGDLNGDGRDEVAISAPYEDEGRGSVYIYSAAEILSDIQPTELKWLQIIKPEGYFTIGHSLAVIRNNVHSACNGLAIGAPGSDRVLFLNCLPQIKISVQNLEEHKTPTYPRARRNETYFVFNSCVNVEYPVRPDIIKADITVKISLAHPTATIANAKNDGSIEYTISTLKEKRSTYCQLVEIVIPQEAGYEPVIQYQVTAIEVDGPLTKATSFDMRHAMVSDLSVLTLTDTLWVADCSGDHECVPELNFQIVTSMSNGYIIGSTDTENLAVSVHNIGDVAYSSCIVFNVVGVRVRSRPPGCTRDDTGDIVCMPSQPIRNNTSWHSGMIELETKSLKSDTEEISFTVVIYDNCKTKGGRREKIKDIKLATDPTGLIIRSSTSFGDEIFLTTTEIEETGKQMSHIYTIFNNGITVWANLVCDIIVDKKSFFKDVTVTIDTEATYKCDKVIPNEQGQFVTRCVVHELRKNRKFDVILTINLEPGTIDSESLEKKNTTLSSSLTLTFGGNKKQQSVKSTLKIKEAVVPLWVIIAATLVGILIMIIIAIALYECGFLRRKNKEKLRSLKRNVHRQSVRRSMAVRESVRAEAANKPEDKDELLEEIPLVKSPSNPMLLEDKLLDDNLPEIRPLPSDVHFSTSNPATEPHPEKKKKELIILGLQKNIGSKQRPPPPPKPTRPK